MKTMEKTTYIKGGLNYARLIDVMLMLMCWNWDFSMDTCEGILTIHGYHRSDFLVALIHWEGMPEDLTFSLDDDIDTLRLETRLA